MVVAEAVVHVRMHTITEMMTVFIEEDPVFGWGERIDPIYRLDDLSIVR